MSVLIKGMEMPSCCDDCWALDEYGDYPVCRITEEQRGCNFRIREKRMDKCPLVSVPPHGRLIDADALMNLIREHSYPLTAHFNSTDYGMFTIGIQQAVDETPTIIEAEEGQ